jgi:hypothetical protein
MEKLQIRFMWIVLRLLTDFAFYGLPLKAAGNNENVQRAYEVLEQLEEKL